MKRRCDRLAELAALALLLVVGSILLFWRLDKPYLWQDEAGTAVLGERFMEYGKPLGYDGRNLVTIDSFCDDDGSDLQNRASSVQAAIAHSVRLRHFRPDTAWTGHPWGQFVVAGVSLRLFGKSTTAARLPFAAAGLLTVLLLYGLVRRVFRSRLTAGLAAALLVSNAFWILHSRQCRYYPLSGLFLLLTVWAFVRWWEGARRYAWVAFALISWCWFNVDYGTFWPVMGVLFTVAVISLPARRREVMGVAGAVALAVAPMIVYYQLLHRLLAKELTFVEILSRLACAMNQYVIPILVLGAAVGFLAVSWRRLAPSQRLLLTVAALMVPALIVWVACVAALGLLRYIVSVTPLACMLTAWVLVQVADRFPAWCGLPSTFRWWRPWIAIALGVVLAVSPVVSNVAATGLLGATGGFPPTGQFIRPELGLMLRDVFQSRPDPNRAAIEWVRQRARPADEILINYEDMPFMFYLDNPIRGGVPAFRVADRSSEPRFLVYRHSVRFVHTALFQREIERPGWHFSLLKGLDMPWGNNPDPLFHTGWQAGEFPDLLVAERMVGTNAAACSDPAPRGK